MTNLHDVELSNLNSDAKTASEPVMSPDAARPLEAALGISTRASTRPDLVGTARADINFERQDLWVGNSDMTDKDDLGAVPDASMLSLFRGLVNFLMEESRKRGWDDVSASLRQVDAAIATRASRYQGPH
jgi:hypothetical protein